MPVHQARGTGFLVRRGLLAGFEWFFDLEVVSGMGRARRLRLLLRIYSRCSLSLSLIACCCSANLLQCFRR